VSTRLARPLLGLVVFLGMLVVWDVWARAEGSFLVPPASEIAETAWEVWPTTAFLSEVGASLRRLGVGLLIGGAIGVAVGLLMGSSLWARRVLDPLVELLRATPPIALVPALIVVLGFGDSMLIAIIAFGVCFPILVGTLDGVRAVTPEARDTAAMLHVRPVERVLRVSAPAALPSIMAGIRVALSVGLVLVVLSEFFGDGGGLGYYINDQRGRFNVPEMYAGVLFLGFLGYALNHAFLLVERRVLAWHYGAAGESAV
jgi:ABC-type nitrate/sulfonate/bicarbonate transport system permease component